MMGQVVTIPPTQTTVDAYRMSTDAASVCKDIVVATSSNIQGRKYVSVEGWQAIAIAHGCAAGSGHVEKVDGGVRAIGEVRRMSDGQLIATAEGFVGEDEETWYGGKNKWGKELPKRADYAIRAMAQTRAISRACRSAFAHVVVMMNAGLQTTPAEEVPQGGFDDEPRNATPRITADEPKPEPRQTLDGPYSSPSKLKAAIKSFAEALRTTQDDLAGFNAWMATDEVIELERAALRYLPNWWETGEGMPPEFEPIVSRIQRKAKELEELDSIANSAGAKNVRAG